MKNILFSLLVFIAACRNPNQKVFKYDGKLFQCKSQLSSCGEPISDPYFKIDSLQQDKKIPVYDFCKKDSILSAILSNEAGKTVYNTGTLQDTANLRISTMLIENSSGASVHHMTGFILLKKVNDLRYYLFRSSDAGVDQETRLETRYKEGYFYIYQISNPHYDVVNSSGASEKLITYCIVDILKDGKPVVLNGEDGDLIRKKLF